MQNQLFKRLECKALESWEHVRDVVCVQLMGDGVFAVPYLNDASYYDLGGVVVKEARSPMEKLRRRAPGAMAIGRFGDFICPGSESNGFRLENMRSTQEPKSNLNPNYQFTETGMKNGEKKSIVVEVTGCYRASYTKLPVENSANVNMLDKGFHHLTKFYLIHTVFYAQTVRIKVNVNGKCDEHYITETIPLGFELRKYRFGPEGVLGRNDNVTDQHWMVTWIDKSKIRTPMDKLPDVPCKDDEDADGYITLPGACAATRNS